MAIKHLTAPLLASGVLLGYAAWAHFKKARPAGASRAANDSGEELDEDSSRRTLDSILDSWASNSSAPDASMTSDGLSATSLSHGLERSMSSSILNHGLSGSGVSSGVVAGTGLSADGHSGDGLTDGLSLEDVFGKDLFGNTAAFSQRSAYERDFGSDGWEPERGALDGAQFSRDGVPQSLAAKWANDKPWTLKGDLDDDSSESNIATPEEPAIESPLVEFAASEQEEDEQARYDEEGALAPEDLGVRWLARATEALSPYNQGFNQAREVQDDWVEAGLIAEASVRAADGGDLFLNDEVLDEEIEVLSEDLEPASRQSEVLAFRS